MYDKYTFQQLYYSKFLTIQNNLFRISRSVLKHQNNPFSKKIMKKVLVTITFVLVLLSCTENKPENTTITESSTSYISESSSKSIRGKDIIDQLYFELIKDNHYLQTLDDKIKKTNQEATQVIAEYNTIIDRSESYYRDAQYHANTISDSLLKNEMIKDIQNSSDQYFSKIKNVKDLIAQVNTNEKRLNDLYTIFKTRKTLPEIEKYQDINPLKTDELNTFVNKQSQLLNELKNLK